MDSQWLGQQYAQDPYKLKSDKTPASRVRGEEAGMKLHPYLKSYWQLMTAERRVRFLRAVWQVLCIWAAQIELYWYKIKLQRTGSWVGRERKGCGRSWVNMIQTHSKKFSKEY